MKIAQLKNLGHHLLEEYKMLSGSDGRAAYAELEKRMKGKNPHFSAMKTKKELRLAIGTLKKMIYKATNK